MTEKRVLVTVGTTKFNELLTTVLKPEILDSLISLGYTKIQFQTGWGSYNKISYPNVKLSYKRYFEDFDKQIDMADLVISHGGAGTCLDVLRKQKPLIVVINENLMDNHQFELAEQLQLDGYVYFCTCETLQQILSKDLNKLKLYPERDETLFNNYLDKCMGFL